MGQVAAFEDGLIRAEKDFKASNDDFQLLEKNLPLSVSHMDGGLLPWCRQWQQGLQKKDIHFMLTLQKRKCTGKPEKTSA